MALESQRWRPSFHPMVVLLDIDGTLVDTNYLHVEGFARALHEHDIIVPRAAIHHQIGKGAKLFLPMWVGEEKLREKIDQRHIAIVKELEKFAFALPGARELLHALWAEHHSLWLATSAKPEELKSRLKTLDVEEKFFAGVISAGDVERAKPHPDIFLEAMKRAGTRDAIVLGDTIWDMQAAKAAGARAIGVLTGGAWSASELSAAGADAVFSDCADLRARGLALLR